MPIVQAAPQEARHRFPTTTVFPRTLRFVPSPTTLYPVCLFLQAGINVRKGTIGDIYVEHVIQPVLVNSSALKLATECVGMILKIEDGGRHVG